MVGHVEEYYWNALIAQAAYGDFSDADPDNDGVFDESQIILALEKVGSGEPNYTDVQAELFIRRFQLIYEDYDSVTGFRASLFLDGATNKYTLAIAGTEIGEPVLDGIYADLLGIAVSGFAEGQISSARAFYYHLIDAGIVTTTDKINVTGHSLGGHLATVFALEHSEVVDHVYTFNAAGTGDGDLGAARVQLNELLGIEPDSLSGGAIDNSQITNIYAYTGPELTAGVGILYGDVIPVFVEDNGPIDNHSISHLSDGLAVYKLFDRIQSGVSVTTVSSILESSVPVVNESSGLKEVVNAVARLFGQTVSWSAGDNRQYRDDLYRNIGSLEVHIDARRADLVVSSLAGLDGSSLLALANPDTGGAVEFRYAIQELNPFAVAGDTSLYISGTQEDYLDWEAFSLDYWHDRSNLLYWKIRSNQEDPHERSQGDAYYNAWVLPEYEEPVLYQDLRSEYEVRLGNTTQIIAMPEDAFTKITFGDIHTAETIIGGDRSDRLYGGLLGDSLSGGEGDDYLEGGYGDDYLEGGSGGDILRGGDGNDAYVYHPGDGLDIIHDSDGLGRIVYDGNTLTGGVQVSPDVFRSQDENYSYILGHNTGSADTLVIRGADGHMVVKGFVDGDLGISLLQSEPPLEPVPESARQISGDFEPMDFDAGEGVEYRYDDLGNLILDPDKPAATHDILAGSSINDHIYGGQSDDVLAGLQGHDHLEGGNDSDRLDGGEGADLLEGGAGTDIIAGGDGDDSLFAGTRSEWPAVFAPGATLTGPDRDWLSGAGGDDLLVGSSGDNGLAGGAGRDLIVAGAGQDNIFGDASWLASDFGWGYEDNGGGRIFSPVSGEQDPGGGDADTIYGGSGNDYIHGQAGDDVIFGDEDEDYIVGNGGADTLLGGAGADRVFGDDGTADFSVHGNDLIEGGTGDDYLVGHAGSDHISGDEGNDVLFGDAGVSQIPAAWHGHDTLSGGGGDDTIYGHGGNDTITGGGGADNVYGNDGNDLVYGGTDNDVLAGGDGADTVFGEEGDDRISGNAGNDGLHGGAGSDRLHGDDGDDVLTGELGNDELYANAGNDVVLGGAGDDLLQGNSGHDYLAGGSGNDDVAGGSGDDTYVYNTGDGIETLTETPGCDSVRFGPGLEISSASIFFSGGFLIFEFSATDILYVQDNAVEHYIFADGVSLSPDNILEHAVFIEGSQGDDVIRGTSGGDVFLLGQGNDEVYGAAGDDIYVYHPGDGHDVIEDGAGALDALVFGYGIDPAQMTVSHQDLDLVITLEADDSITLSKWFAGRQIEVFDFANGVQFDAQTMEQLAGAPLVAGDATRDILVGGAENEIFRGNGGDDTLIGGGGDDTFIYNPGDGLDRIETAGDGVNDRLVLGEGIDPEHTIARYASRDTEDILELRFLDMLGRIVAGSGVDVVTRPADVAAADSPGYGVERIVFADGTEMTPGTLVQKSVNHAPQVNATLPGQVAAEDALFEYALPVDAFVDTDSIDSLTYEAMRADGSGLPEWLVFNSYTRSFSGIPQNGDVGALDITVRVTDARGLSVSNAFRITVNNTNDAPILENPLPDQTAEDGQAYSFAIPEITFSDPDAGDTLSFSASLADGQPLPEWLVFEPSGRILTGLPGPDQVGSYEIEIGVADTSGSHARDVFTLEVQMAEPEPPNVIDSNGGSETLAGTEGVDHIFARRGNDEIYGLAGDDVIDGGRGRDEVYGGSGDDDIFGQRGNDRLAGQSGDDSLSGGAGDDELLGGRGNDILTGGDGDDYLEGGAGSDTYHFDRGDDVDTLADDGNAGIDASVDRVLFGETIRSDQLWFQRIEDNLMVSIIGTRDEIMLTDWYAATGSQIEEFHVDGGLILNNTRVEQLVAAMAAFRPLHPGELNLPAEYQEELFPVIAQAWQAA